MNLKQTLLSTELFIDNEYLDKYVELISQNSETPQTKFRTQSHHIIPRFVYLHKNEPIDESSSNKVNLLFKDHITAHYLLSNCGANFHICNKNYLAIKCLIDTTPVEFQEELDDHTLNELQHLYENIKRTGPLSESTKKKISSSIVGRISITKDGKYKYIYPEELSTYESAGWVRGHSGLDKNARLALSEAQKGRIRLHKGDKIVAVRKDEVDKYISEGYVKGEPPRERGSLKGRVAIHREGKVMYVSPDNLAAYLEQGWQKGTLKGRTGPKKGIKFSEEHKRKIGENSKGRIHIHNHTIHKMCKPEEVEYYLSLGFTLGSGVSSCGTSNKIWITKDDIEKYIHPCDLDVYMSEGWTRGRKNRKSRK